MWARPDDYYTSQEFIIKGDWKGKLSRLREELKMEYEQNSMRHSFASYHIAKFSDPARTCLMLGHIGDYNTLYGHYRNAVTPIEAERYFNIYPKTIKRKGGNITLKQLKDKLGKHPSP
jgi:hypothetical protein